MRSVLFSLLLLGASSPASASLIAYWNFNDNSKVDNTGFPSTISADAGTGTLSFSSEFTDSEVTNPANSGTTDNALFGDPAEEALAVRSNIDPDSNNGAYIDLNISTIGFEDIVLSYATTQDSNSGFEENQWFYSVNGGAFTSFTNADLDPPNGSWEVNTFDLSSIAALDGALSVVLRYVFDGAQTTGLGNINNTHFLDNIQINGTAVAVVPEPASLAMLGLGALGLCFLRRRSA